MKLRVLSTSIVCLLFLPVFMMGVEQAQADPERGYQRKAPRSPVVRNHLYEKYRYYPVGYRTRQLPGGYYALSKGRSRYYYHSGVYYRHSGRDYVVVNAPFGAYVQSLAYGYRTVYYRGNPYFYSVGAYYLWDDMERAYRVVPPPGGLDDLDVADETPTATRDIFVYPAKGQSVEQTSRDRYECYLWATDQTGFDPGSGNEGDAAAYQRALGACLEGRDYTVK